MTPAYRAAVKYCQELDLPVSIDKDGSPSMAEDPSSTSSDVCSFMAGWEACAKEFFETEQKIRELKRVIKDSQEKIGVPRVFVKDK